MGMHTTIYGYIKEMNYWKGPVQQQVRLRNNRALESIKLADEWPPLSREMFTFTENSGMPGPNLEYDGRIIHFGASAKGIEYEWAEWKEKFERLLEQLIFETACVHLKTEYSSLWTATWKTDLDKYSIVHDNTAPFPVSRSQWFFTSDF